MSTFYDQQKTEVCQAIFGNVPQCDIENMKSGTKDVKPLSQKAIKNFMSELETKEVNFFLKTTNDGGIALDYEITPKQDATKEQKPVYVATKFFGADNTVQLAETKKAIEQRQKDKLNQLAKGLFEDNAYDNILEQIEKDKEFRVYVAEQLAKQFTANGH